MYFSDITDKFVMITSDNVDWDGLDDSSKNLEKLFEIYEKIGKEKHYRDVSPISSLTPISDSLFKFLCNQIKASEGLVSFQGRICSIQRKNTCVISLEEATFKKLLALYVKNLKNTRTHLYTDLSQIEGEIQIIDEVKERVGNLFD